MNFRNFEETFPQNSEVRTTKTNALKSSHQTASRILVTSMTQQQKATEDSLRDLETLFYSTILICQNGNDISTSKVFRAETN